MTITRSNSFESGLAAGTAVTNAAGGNSGGAAGNYLNAAFASAGNSIQYHATAMHGGLSARMLAEGGGSTSLGYDDVEATAQVTAMRGYFRWSKLHTGNLVVMQTRGIEAGNTGFFISLTPEGILRVMQGTGTVVLAVLPRAISLNVWYRLEFRVSRSGDWAFRLYRGDSYVLEEQELSGTDATSGMAGGFTFWRWAMDGSAVNATQYVDDIAYGDDWIGPVVTGEARPVAIVNAVGWVPTGSQSLAGALSDDSDATLAESPGLTAAYQPMVARIGELSLGDITVRVRLAGDGLPTARVRLMQGTTVISTWSIANVPAAATSYALNVTPAEAAKVTDRAALRVEVAGIL